MPSSSALFKEYLSDVFVETGSYVGDGIAYAIEAGFNKVYSIELADKYFDHCTNRFANDHRVTVVKGDSGIMLYDAIKDVTSRITFWLDGHHSCGDTALGCAWSPLMEELKLIGKHHIKEHTIIIDDMICWEKENPVIGFGIKDIQEVILSINSDYKFFYKGGYWGDKYCDKYILIAKV
jgi:hypothetical protein